MNFLQQSRHEHILSSASSALAVSEGGRKKSARLCNKLLIFLLKEARSGEPVI